MQLEAAGSGTHLLFEGFGSAGIALAEESQVHGKPLGGLKHPADVEGSRGACGGVGAGCRTRASTHQGGHAAGQCRFNLLGADEMDMGVDPTCCEDVALARNRFGAGAHNDGDPLLCVGVTRFANANDASVSQPHIGFDDSPPVENQCIGDHRVNGSFGSCRL